MRRGRLAPWYRLGIALLKPPALLLTCRTSTGAGRVPPGGVVVVSNHVSLVDPVVLCDFLLHDVRRIPRLLAKRELFEGRGLLARVMRGAGQIPVERHTPDAARGAHRRRCAPPVPRRGLRRTVCFRVGPPVDLSPWCGCELTRAVLREATEAVMDALTAELEVLRGERAPRPRFDPRVDAAPAGRAEQRRTA